jgi:hypothetical protein
MQTTMTTTTYIESKKLVQPYIWTTVGAGGLIYLLAAYRLDVKIVDFKFGLLVVITGLLSSRITIKIPQFGSWISVSDIFIFLTLWLYGSEAAILVAATEAFLSSFRSNYCRKLSTILFNWACAVHPAVLPVGQVGADRDQRRARRRRPLGSEPPRRLRGDPAAGRDAAAVRPDLCKSRVCFNILMVYS